MSYFRTMADVYTGQLSPDEAAELLQRQRRGRWWRFKAWVRRLLVREN